MICDICTSAISQIVSSDFARYGYTYGAERRRPPFVRHHENFLALATSANQGCKLCRLFHDATSRQYEAGGRLRWDADDLAAGFELGGVWKEVALQDAPVKWMCAGLTFQLEQGQYDFGEVLYFRLEQLRGDLPQLVNMQITSNPNLDIPLEWIKRCSHNHSGCPDLDLKELPTRLVDVGDVDTEPKLLVTTTGQRGSYLALSHCWGGVEAPNTTAANLESRKIEISFSELPRTFQDAVIVARGLWSLNVRYLWIDCFCILQDDEQDFQREAANMHRTFANALAVICGPSANNPNTGFLHSRDFPDVFEARSTEFELATVHDKRVKLRLSEETGSGGGPWKEYLRTSELSKRAWIVQERLLSSRSLFFTRNQMYMECNGADFFESINYPLATLRYPYSKMPLVTQSDHPLAFWRRIIIEYSSCSLTQGKDRLPALSGTASVFHSLLKCRYFAGMWEADLVSELSWKRSGQRQGGVTGNFPRSLVPPTVFPPSWSWASCDYAITLTGGEPNDVEHAKVLHVRISPVGLDPYGQVAGGFLKIQARARMGKASRKARPDVRPTADHDPTAQDQVYFLENDRLLGPIGEYYRDVPTYTHSRTTQIDGQTYEDVLVVLLHAGYLRLDVDVKAPSHWNAILLQPAAYTDRDYNPAHTGAYRRMGKLAGKVGTLHSYDSGFTKRDQDMELQYWQAMMSSESQTLTII